MNKTYLLGDIHGKTNSIKCLLDANQEIINSTLILLGDVGANFFFNYRDENFKKALNDLNLTIFIIRGNHEERPSNCVKKEPNQWHTEKFFENLVYVENKYSNIKYALDVPAKYIIPIEDKKINTLILPGAYSIDKQHRIFNNLTWFKDEQLTKEEMLQGTSLAASQNWDLILSHTCPIYYEPVDLFLPFIDQNKVDKTMEYWLDDIEKSVSYKLWAFGHFHETRIYPTHDNKNAVMLFNHYAFDLYKYFYENKNIEDCLV